MTTTSKRQVTLPVDLGKELGLRPGHRVLIEQQIVEGEMVWILRRAKPDWSWVGAARRYGKGKSNRWADVKRSIARGWSSGGS